VKLINEIFSDENIEVEEKLLVSMELFTSARLETSYRAKFVGLVSALEPLAQQEHYANQELEKLVNSFVKQLTDTSIPDNIKRSVEGRIRDLKKEQFLKQYSVLCRSRFRQMKKLLVSSKMPITFAAQFYMMDQQMRT
jgi:uncharacterized protein (UPF0147 family)